MEFPIVRQAVLQVDGSTHSLYVEFEKIWPFLQIWSSQPSTHVSWEQVSIRVLKVCILSQVNLGQGDTQEE